MCKGPVGLEGTKTTLQRVGGCVVWVRVAEVENGLSI